jgi:hypothetical protein
VNKAKAKGTAWETAVVRFLQTSGFPDARRKVLAGRFDLSDVDIDGRGRFAGECKDHQHITLSEFVDEAVVEAENAHADYGVAIVKRRNKGVGEAYAVMRLSDWTKMAVLLVAAT